MGCEYIIFEQISNKTLDWNLAEEFTSMLNDIEKNGEKFNAFCKFIQVSCRY